MSRHRATVFGQPVFWGLLVAVLLALWALALVGVLR